MTSMSVPPATRPAARVVAPAMKAEVRCAASRSCSSNGSPSQRSSRRSMNPLNRCPSTWTGCGLRTVKRTLAATWPLWC
ncbi:hypothetical protein ABT040_21920 [Streptomyces sp. NPDC002688]|uniref:hypothetical protein n=1 Tax=Streptomyces sp. NPDC002688 TaxID=3154423 RepID=UPI003316BA73